MDQSSGNHLQSGIDGRPSRVLYCPIRTPPSSCCCVHWSRSRRKPSEAQTVATSLLVWCLLHIYASNPARSATFRPSTPLLDLMIPAHSPHQDAGCDGQPCPPVPASFVVIRPTTPFTRLPPPLFVRFLASWETLGGIVKGYHQATR